MNSNHITPIVLSALMYVVCFALFAELAINGPLMGSGRTFFAMAIAGVGLIAATAVVATVIVDAREDRRYRQAIAARG